MWKSDRSPLPEWIKNVYSLLEDHIADSNADCIKQNAAVTLIVDQKEVPTEDAQHAVKRLLNRGHLYEVNEELYITDTETDDDNEAKAGSADS